MVDRLLGLMAVTLMQKLEQFINSEVVKNRDIGGLERGKLKC
jgi:hypothetical protein